MIPLGYMYKRVATWAAAPAEASSPRLVYSMSACLSGRFMDFHPCGRHNRSGVFDSPALMEALAAEHDIALGSCQLFYYEASEDAFDESTGQWSEPEVDSGGEAHQVWPLPAGAVLAGFDVVAYEAGTPGCSPLTCNEVGAHVPVNRRCLFETQAAARAALEAGAFSSNCEPGPFRVVAVYAIPPAPRGETAHRSGD